jgi:RimJ/RimL family protein N-acetyltransferase
MSNSRAPDGRTFIRTTLDLVDHSAAAHSVGHPDSANDPDTPDGANPTVRTPAAVRLHPWSRRAAGSEPTIAALIAAAADPDTALWNPIATADRAAATQWLEARVNGWDNNTVASFAALEPDGTLLGNVTLRWIDRPDGLAMIGYWLLPAARGRGLATSATIAVTEWAFRTAGARRIELAHAVENTASCRVAHRCGYLPEGTLRASHCFGDGRHHDEHLHARLATDPAPGRK